MNLTLARLGFRPGLTWGHAAKALVLTAAIGQGIAYLSERYVLGIDSQWFRCLSESHFVIDTWRLPDASEIEPLDIVSFEMTDRQAMAPLGWKAGDRMAKRVLASEPGTRIDVREDGVHFQEPGPAGRSWKFGRGLEAAEVLGQPPETFIRQFVLQPGELWVMGDMKYSVDSRYYGPISADQINGTVVAAW
jgi:hypothetical protein